MDLIAFSSLSYILIRLIMRRGRETNKDKRLFNNLFLEILMKDSILYSRKKFMIQHHFKLSC